MDGGDSWTAVLTAGIKNWRTIKSNSLYNKFVASVYGGNIYISYDTLVTWTELTAAGTGNWIGMFGDSTFSKMLAVKNPGSVFHSVYDGAIDAATTWTDGTGGAVTQQLTWMANQIGFCSAGSYVMRIED